MKTSARSACGGGTCCDIGDGRRMTGAQTAEPYKLGMFQQGARFCRHGDPKDTVVVDLSRANVGAPATLKQLIAQWDATIGTRLATLAAAAQGGAAISMKFGSRRCRRLPIRRCC